MTGDRTYENEVEEGSYSCYKTDEQANECPLQVINDNLE